jgi:hypothetical protein
MMYAFYSTSKTMLKPLPYLGEQLDRHFLASPTSPSHSSQPYMPSVPHNSEVPSMGNERFVDHPDTDAYRPTVPASTISTIGRTNEHPSTRVQYVRCSTAMLGARCTLSSSKMTSGTSVSPTSRGTISKYTCFMSTSEQRQSSANQMFRFLISTVISPTLHTPGTCASRR